MKPSTPIIPFLISSKPRATLAMLCLMFVAALHADDYDNIRARWKEMLDGGTGYNVSNPEIATRLNLIATSVASNGSTRDAVNGTGFWDKLNTSPTRTYLWSDVNTPSNQLGYAPDLTTAYNRLKAMALAYTTYGSSLQGNATLLADTISALDWMYAHRYNEGATQVGNWWDWQIGAPMALNDTSALLYSQLSATQVADYMRAVRAQTPNPGAGSSTNRMWFCKVLAYYGVLLKDSATITGVAHAYLNSIFSYTTTGDGVYLDGSFRFHSNHAYNGGYGVSLITTAADYLYLFEASPWPVTVTNRSNLYKWLYDSFEPMVFKGEVFDMSRGREASRVASPAHSVGRRLISGFMRMAQIAPSADSQYYKSVVKHWIQTDTTFATSASGFSIFDTLLAQTILNDSAITPRSSYECYTQYSMIDRVVAHRPAWASALSTHSTRIKNYESASGENLKGWNTGAGALYVYTSDLNQFNDNFWPTVNQRRLPGTTVEAGYNAASSAYSSQSFVGGVESWSGLDGVSGMALGPSGRTLRGNKAWFFFDDEIVALGAGITASGGNTLETILENRKLTSAGTNTFSVNGSAALTTLPATATLTGVNYAYLAGNAGSNDGLGYYFPTAVTLQGTREARTANWYSINTLSGTTTNYTRNYLTLWFDHGINPAAASYAYAVLPGATSAATTSYAAAPDFTVLENSTNAQAVKENTLGEVGAIFWSDAVKTVGTGPDAITVDKKAAVLVTQPSSGDVRVAVSDPTQLNTGTINVSLGASAAGVISSDIGVNVTSVSPIQFTVNANAAQGRTHRVQFGTFGQEDWSNKIDNPPSASVTYSGSWTHATDANYYNSTRSVSSSAGNYVQFTFSGTGARLYVKTGSSFGKLSITVNNGPAKVIDCYSATDTYKVRVFQVTQLEPGTNTLRATVSSGTAGIDFLEVQKKWSTVDNPASSSVAYTGTWAHSADSLYYNNTKSVSNTVGSYVQFTFSGTGARLYVRTAPSLGKLNIRIDGGTDASFNCYETPGGYQVKLYEVTGLPFASNHTLRATVATRDPLSSGNYVGIDCFESLP